MEVLSILIGWLIERSLEIKLPTVWTDEKQSREEAERRERLEERRVEEKEDADAWKGRKVAKHWRNMFFQWFVAPEGRKSRLAKAAGAEPAGQMRDEKLHAVVARSTFASQNVQNTWVSEHFWKLRCRKSARHCGAKHISKLRCGKSARHCGAKHISQFVKNTRGSDHFWKFRCRKSARRLARSTFWSQNVKQKTGVRTTFGGSDVASCGRRKGFCTLSKVSKTWGNWSIFNYNHHYTTLHSNTLHYTTTTTRTTPSLHSTTLHSTTLHSITFNYTTLHYTSLHYITLHPTTLQLQLHNYTPLH